MSLGISIGYSLGLDLKVYAVSGIKCQVSAMALLDRKSVV
jgi:hypothetical protein